MVTGYVISDAPGDPLTVTFPVSICDAYHRLVSPHHGFLIYASCGRSRVVYSARSIETAIDGVYDFVYVDRLTSGPLSVRDASFYVCDHDFCFYVFASHSSLPLTDRS